MFFDHRYFPSKQVNKQDGKRASRVEFFFELNKRACSFIRYFRVNVLYLEVIVEYPRVSPWQ